MNKAAPSGRKDLVLLIDDDNSIRSLVARILAQSGYAVESVGNGKEALDCLARSRPAVVICDILMPVMDGVELITQLRRTQADIPVVAVSGGGQIQTETCLKIAEALGAEAVLAKPFSRAQLLEAVAQVLHQKSGSRD